MKKNIRSVLIILSAVMSFSAVADEIPPPLEDDLLQLNLAYVPTLINKTLIIAFNFDEVDSVLAESTVHSMCLSFYGYEKERAWEPGAIERVQIVTNDYAKGYTYNGGDSSCNEMAHMVGDQSNEFIRRHLSPASFSEIIRPTVAK
ncbi:hypothetical protein [Yersinia ruckeri]|uniref:hypothetical protein n=1 Tax=Yersinia ruckeri TaxID=29486 RepID=UPI0020C0D1BA|nr:hypothetical protein [Yersinia ruckeri]MCK8542049.1 hypothetical protein [Yersinia ruckeri]MCK8553121.1 hypothetical protein [Yersinia ruckeri]MCW6519245.1 hypothetical protein [Yersinia ruckeri]MCW6553499.1 hypothetical protein [Yersinia ruckeri]MCW6579638.1 hypothetical protein [Yersinia ruckeri]